MKNKKIFAVLLAVVLLLTFAFVLSACGNDNNANPEDTTAKSGNDETEPIVTDPTETDPVDQAELNVSFDENAVYVLNDEAIADALSAEIVENGVARSVEFTVKSSEVTEDGQYIKVIVSAEGIEKEILLPYEAEPEVYIREDLKPLYELLTKDGDKFFAVEMSGNLVAAEGEKNKTFSFKVLVNDKADGLEFALIDVGATNEKSIAVYRNGVISVCGFDIDLLAQFADGYELIALDDGFAGLFSSLSATLDSLDNVFENPMMAMLGLSKNNGVYNVNTDSKKILSIIQLFSTADEESEFNAEEVIDVIDAALDGALKAGDIKISASISVQEEGIALGLQLQNAKTGNSVGFTAALRTANEAFELPETSAPDLKDIEIEIPVVLPQSNKEITLKAVVRISDIITATGDYITASVSVNGNDNAIVFVVNDKYVYCDASVLADMTMTFYQAFEIDGETVSIFEYLPTLLVKQGENDVSENVDMENGKYIDDAEDDPYNGYGWTAVDGGYIVILPIGATEEDLRQKLVVYGYDDNDEAIPLTDYSVEGFDGSAAFSGIVDIVLEYVTMQVDVVVRDPETETCTGVSVYQLVAPIGIDVATMQPDIAAEIDMTDGNVYWVIYESGFTIDKVDGEEVTEDYVFGTKGNFTLTVTRTATGEQAEAELYVYDPENLEVVDVEFQDEIHIYYTYANITEEELREYIDICVLYDNNESKYVEDYEIVGFEPGDNVVNVRWNEYEEQIIIDYYGGDSNDDQPAGGFDIMMLMKYFRLADLLESEDVFAEIKGIFEQKKDLFKAAFKVDAEAKTLRVVINSKDGGDLVDIVNVFFGIPTEDGFADIDESYLLAYLNSNLTVDTLFNMVTGVELADFLSDLCFEAGISTEDKIAVNLELNNGGDTKYFVTGCAVKLIDSSVSNFELTEADIAGSYEFSMFPMTILGLLMQTLLY